MALKVFDLQCVHEHVFEGWFASREAFDDQKAQGLLSCPVCGTHEIERKLSAARINLGKGSPGASASEPKNSGSTAAASAPSGADLAKVQAQMLKHLREMVKATENVGENFAQEARRIHAGESEDRAIRGTATKDERESLIEEGIAVMPIPDFLDDDRMQ